MKIAELRQLTPKKLRELLEESQRKLAAIKFHLRTGQEQDSSQVRKQKKLIARILTLLKTPSL